MPVSRLDQLYRRILLTKFFTKGWGEPEKLKKLFAFRRNIVERDRCFALVSKDHPIIIDKEETNDEFRILEGHFTSPLVHHVPGVVPPESETAYFQVILPKKWKSHHHPVCLHLAGTGDHFFWRRRALMAKPLLKEAGIGSIILENPFYGLRKPKNQLRSSLHNVSDIFVMGGCLAMESIALFHWCEKQGFGPLGVTGISMGGHMASIAAGVWPKPIVLVPCLSWTTASCVFTQGVMSGAIPWHLLENQYFSDRIYHKEFRSMVTSLIDDHAFKAGQQFVKDYPASLENLPDDKKMEIKPQHSQQATLDLFTQQASDLQLNSTANSSMNSLPSNLNKKEDPSMTLSGAKFASVFSSLSLLKNLNVQRRSSLITHNEAIQFMRGIMDEFTHLANFSKPLDPSLIIVVAARDDAYVLREGIVDLTELWQGAEVRYIDAGHISAFLFNQGEFRKAIADGFDRLIKKNYMEKSEAFLQDKHNSSVNVSKRSIQ